MEDAAAGGLGIEVLVALVALVLGEVAAEEQRDEASPMAWGLRRSRPGEVTASGWRTSERRRAPVEDGDDDGAVQKFGGGVRGVRTRERKEGVQGEASGTFVVTGIDFERQRLW